MNDITDAVNGQCAIPASNVSDRVEKRMSARYKGKESASTVSLCNDAGSPAQEESRNYCNLLTREEANTILANGYPSDEELSRFPLGKVLKEIPDVDPRWGMQNEGKPGHSHRVMDGINILLSNNPECISKQWSNGICMQDTLAFTQAYSAIFGDKEPKQNRKRIERYCQFDFEEVAQPFLRLLAMYHDIGKAVIAERHPTVGWHLVQDVYREEVLYTLYPFLLGRDYRKWQKDLDAAKGNVRKIVSEEEMRLLRIFEVVICYHDYFGVLSTGEASLPVMVDLIELRGTEVQDAQELFSMLMLISLADVYASIEEVLPKKVELYCTDWRMLCETIKEVEGDRGMFFTHLVERSQHPTVTIDRLWRLMFEACPKEWRDEVTPDMIQRIFREVALSRINPFVKNYALFCKLDYCLGFKIALMETARVMGLPVATPVHAMITLLAELEKRYGELATRNDGTRRRLGFELAGLTRKPTTHKEAAERRKSKIGATIAKLLLTLDGLGREWAVGECTVWFMEE